MKTKNKQGKKLLKVYLKNFGNVKRFRITAKMKKEAMELYNNKDNKSKRVFLQCISDKVIKDLYLTEKKAQSPALCKGVGRSDYKYYSEITLGRCKKNKYGHRWIGLKYESNIWVKEQCEYCKEIIVCERQ